MSDHDVIWDHLDGQQALRLAEVFGLDGWLVEWQRLDDGRWEASLTIPTLSGLVAGSGHSRVSAISKAHVLAVRRLRFHDVPETQPRRPELGAGPVSVAMFPAESVLPSP